jgi:hypothetical protein
MSWERLGFSKARRGMGFRDLQVFNKALLAKQGWWLITNPGSLVARIFKEKYYPLGAFMEASIGHRPFYAWRSICQARDVLHLGLGWRVGNGTSIRIWGDAWLPPPYPRLLSPPNPSFNPDERVVALIDNEVGGWNYELLHKIFDPGEVAQICCVVVSPLGQPDRIVWRGSFGGCFFVKSAYHLAVSRRTQEKGESYKEVADGHIWRAIWRLGITLATQHFCWKVITCCPLW